MEKKKEKESILAKKEIDILFVLATLEEAPEKTEILEELELAWQETEKPGRSGRTKNVVKKELDRLRGRGYLKKSMEITERGNCFLINRMGKEGIGKLCLSREEVLEVVRQRGNMSEFVNLRKQK